MSFRQLKKVNIFVLEVVFGAVNHHTAPRHLVLTAVCYDSSVRFVFSGCLLLCERHVTSAEVHSIE